MRIVYREVCTDAYSIRFMLVYRVSLSQAIINPETLRHCRGVVAASVYVWRVDCCAELLHKTGRSVFELIANRTLCGVILCALQTHV